MHTDRSVLGIDISIDLYSQNTGKIEKRTLFKRWTPLPAQDTFVFHTGRQNSEGAVLRLYAGGQLLKELEIRPENEIEQGSEFILGLCIFEDFRILINGAVSDYGFREEFTPFYFPAFKYRVPPEDLAQRKESRDGEYLQTGMDGFEELAFEVCKMLATLLRMSYYPDVYKELFYLLDDAYSAFEGGDKDKVQEVGRKLYEESRDLVDTFTYSGKSVKYPEEGINNFNHYLVLPILLEVKRAGNNAVAEKALQLEMLMETGERTFRKYLRIYKQLDELAESITGGGLMPPSE